jgi:nucleotide-binding universal stress UspA family protein
MAGPRPVVAGVDFSPSSQAAAEYAAQLAIQRKAPLLLIHAHLHPRITHMGIGMPALYLASGEGLADLIDTELKQMAEDTFEKHAGLSQIEARCVIGSPAGVLIEASRHALVTVVGCRGVGGFAELLLGSVSNQVAAHAHGPVVVVRPPGDSGMAPGPVLTGYDGSSGSQAALEFAAAEADARGVALTVAHVYRAESREHAEQLVAQAIATCHERYPALHVDGRTIRHPKVGHALTDASREAALTVVGCADHAGPISRTLTHHAHHPVAVVHPGDGT